MYGVGHSIGKSFANSRTSVPPLGFLADTSTDWRPTTISGRKAITKVSPFKAVSARASSALPPLVA